MTRSEQQNATRATRNKASSLLLPGSYKKSVGLFPSPILRPTSETTGTVSPDIHNHMCIRLWGDEHHLSHVLDTMVSVTSDFINLRIHSAPGTRALCCFFPRRVVPDNPSLLPEDDHTPRLPVTMEGACKSDPMDMARWSIHSSRSGFNIPFVWMLTEKRKRAGLTGRKIFKWA
jgi:hypothetical protein